jgi:hypothetical protein
MYVKEILDLITLLSHLVTFEEGFEAAQKEYWYHAVTETTQKLTNVS